MTVRYVTGLLKHRPAHFDTYRHGGMDAGKMVLDLESLDEVPDGDLLELAASLMTYHLRQAGKLPAVSPGNGGIYAGPAGSPRDANRREDGG